MANQHDNLEQLLGASQDSGTASEVHGFVTGWIASGSNWASARGSFEQHFELAMNEDLDRALGQVAEQVAEGLSDVDFSYALMLPGDKVGINHRRQALSDWCRGFLSGFGLTGRFQDKELSEEVQELLKDFAQIAQVEEEIPEDDDNESDLTEITEYVRMGAIMAFTDCASKAVH